MRYTPVQLLIAYIAFTFAVNVLGPIDYIGFNPVLTGAFLALTCLSIYVGFTFGVRSFAREGPPAEGAPPDFRPIFYACLATAIAGLLFSALQGALQGQVNFSPSELGQSYIDNYASYERNTGTYGLSFLIYSATAPAAFIASVWGLLYFRRLPFLTKGTVALLIIGTLLFYTIGSGKQKQLGDTLIYGLAVGGVIYGRAGKAVNWRVVIPAVLLLFLGMIGFVAILGQRYEAIAIDIFNVNVRSNPLLHYDLDHPLFAWLGYDVGFAFSVLSAYMSQGYFGLSLALESGPTWSYMIGFSYSLMVIADRAFGLPFLINDTYPYIVGAEVGWDETKWHSAFTHWASDFTFPGTVVLFGFFAFAYAKAWNRAIAFDNPFAVLLFALMTQGAIFIPANNQLFISPGSVATVVTVVALYLWHARRPFAPVRPADPVKS